MNSPHLQSFKYFKISPILILGLLLLISPALGQAQTSGSDKSTQRRHATAQEDADKPRKSPSADAVIQRALKAIRSGDLALAEDMIKSAAAQKNPAEKSAWLVVESKLELARHAYAKAGLLAMRVVILHSDSREVGEALYCTARAYEGMQQPTKALDLYKECLTSASSSRATQKKAEKRIAELQARSPSK